ncbi:MAG: hypothetical protein V4576_00625 [Patescibacteria group bacterium]
MSYQSGDKKNILGHRLSNRYLSSDAFTSSAGKTGGRSISRLGSLFSRQKHNRRFSGTGQKVGLFELKNIFIKLCVVAACIAVLAYTIPFTRYKIHAIFAKYADVYNTVDVTEADDVLGVDEKYVSPVLTSTDRFLVNVDDMSMLANGSYVYASPMNTLVGIFELATSSTPQVVLFSEVGFKNNLFLKDSANTIPFDAAATNTTILNAGDTASTTTTTVNSTTSEVVQIAHVNGYSSIIFEGLGYGQMLAKVPPQVEIPVGTILYARTQSGLKPAGRVSYIETDTGSTFTNVYAQILTAPYAIYKVKLTE